MRLGKFALMGFACLMLASPALAQDPPTACDPEYMDALESRAWMEAQREITQNQNLITKPDSVLEYTCFNKFLNHLVRTNGDMRINGVQRLFSETNHWEGPPTGLSASSTDLAVERVVGDSMRRYLRTNFGHGFMGDRLPNIDYINSDSSKDHAGATAPVHGEDYECERMQQVWANARCMNFLMREGQDGFYDFPWYMNNDPRNLPESTGYAACSAAGGAGGGVSDAYRGIWEPAIQSAFNRKPQTYTIRDTENSNVGGGGGGGGGTPSSQPQEDFVDTTPYKTDEVETHLDKIRPGECGHSIKTGIHVRRNAPGGSGGVEEFDEVICTNPACSADASGNCQVATPSGGGGG